MNNKTSNTAFTLIEVLIVIVIISLMGSMVMTAVSGVTTTAKQSRTKTIIAIVDSVLAEQYENFKYRQLPVESPDFASPPNPDGRTLGLEISAMEAARVRLMMSRDLQRMEMPDRYSDFVKMTGNVLQPIQAVDLGAMASPTVLEEDGSVIKQETEKDKRRLVTVSWPTSGRINTFFKRTESNFKRLKEMLEQAGSNELPTINALPIVPARQYDLAKNNQGAECLYLIMATSYVGGIPALESIPSSNIGDTDGDLMLEILDGWGRPLEFVRWPIGYFSAEDQVIQKVTATLIQRDVAADTAEDFDLFRTDFAYSPNVQNVALAFRVTNPNNPPGSSGKVPPWSMRPLVFSRGSDGESGIYSNPNDEFVFSYRNNWINNWPADQAHCGDESPGRDNPFTFPDPYLRTGSITRRPGERIRDAQGNFTPASVDNITNYELQVSQR